MEITQEVAPTKKNVSSRKKTTVRTKAKAVAKRTMFQYSKNDLKQALHEVRINNTSVREASRRYKVPRTTLQDRLTGRVPDELSKPGPQPLLTEEGENKIKEWVINLSKCGFPIKKDMLLKTVSKINLESGLNLFKGGMPKQTWYSNFIRRNPEIPLREAEGINRARAVVTEEAIRKWFLELNDYIKENHLEAIFSNPQRIFNGDESGFSLCPKSGKVLGPKGFKNLFSVQQGNAKENMTVLVVFNSDGKFAPPLVLFPYVRPPRAVVDNMPNGWVLGKSEKGWMTSDVFFEYLCNDFTNWLLAENIERPIILFVDGHKSHLTLATSQWCDNNQIILYALPPNTTHMLQPADVSVFKPMKADWKKTVRKWQSKSENVNVCVTKTNFCKIFNQVFEETDFTETIHNGFRKCGLYPLNPDSVDYSKCVANTRERPTNNNRRSSENISQRDLRSAKKVINRIKDALMSCGINTKVILNEIVSLESIISPKKNNNIVMPVTLATSAIVHAEPSDVPSNAVPDKITTEQCKLINSKTGSVVGNDDSLIFEIPNCIGGTFTESFINTITRDICEDLPIINITEIEQVRELEISEDNDNLEDIPDRQEEGMVDIADDGIEIEWFDIHEQENDKGDCETGEQERESEIEDSNNSSESKIIQEQEKIHSIDNNDNKTESDEKKIIQQETQTVLVNELMIDRKEEIGRITPTLKEIFSNHLTYPEPIKRSKNTNRPKNEKAPSGISSDKWRRYYKVKEQEKLQKRLDIEKRRKKREELKQIKLNKLIIKKKKPIGKVTNTAKKENMDAVRKTPKKIPCALCKDILNSDTEDEDKKNIGCDYCDNWYHKKCTEFYDTPYAIAEAKDYKCDFC